MGETKEMFEENIGVSDKHLVAPKLMEKLSGEDLSEFQWLSWSIV